MRVINNYGLGDYLNWDVCPVARIVDPGSALPAVSQAMGMGELVPASPGVYPQFLVPQGLGCGCGGCDRGLGYFDSGLDLNGWGWLEWTTVIFGVYAFSSLFFDVKRSYGRVRGGMKKRSARRSRVAAAKRRYEKELETA